jgi:hypothetical protein
MKTFSVTVEATCLTAARAAFAELADPESDVLEDVDALALAAEGDCFNMSIERNGEFAERETPAPDLVDTVAGPDIEFVDLSDPAVMAQHPLGPLIEAIFGINRDEGNDASER